MRNAFTLIELIIVIVLLGILSAVAVPKYFDLTTDAHKSKVKGAQSALATGIGLMQSKYLISKETQGVSAWSNDFPEPAGDADCTALWTAAMSSSTAAPTAVGELAAGAPDFMYGHNPADGCVFYYTGTVNVGDIVSDEAQFAVVYKENGTVNFAEKVKNEDGSLGALTYNGIVVGAGGGDPGAGDPGAGDPGAGDPGAGDPGAGDPP